tara:strand:+ start:736 stop:945 length:210 start_codon:yes stop_codon:yes gene_type:complete
MNKKRSCCEKQDCRCWIDYPEDDNCINVSIEKHGAMTLAEIAKRLGISLVRVSQIEKSALKKLSKRIKI